MVAQDRARPSAQPYLIVIDLTYARWIRLYRKIDYVLAKPVDRDGVSDKHCRSAKSINAP